MRVLLPLIVLALLLPAVAEAGVDRSLRLNDAKVGTTKTELLAQRSYSRRVIRHLTGRWLVAPRHATCWTHVPWSKTCDHARRRLLAQRWLYTVALRKLHRLYPPPPPPRAGPSWLVSAFECIHRYEGAWNSETGNGYHGGLQMDDSFQASYGPEYLARWGNAGNWPPSVQIAVAVRAYSSGRGFGPWPNTSRMCGL